jgi:hypothetical protein
MLDWIAAKMHGKSVIGCWETLVGAVRAAGRKHSQWFGGG